MNGVIPGGTFERTSKAMLGGDAKAISGRIPEGLCG